MTILSNNKKIALCGAVAISFVAGFGNDHGYGRPDLDLHTNFPTSCAQPRNGSIAIRYHAVGQFGSGPAHTTSWSLLVCRVRSWKDTNRAGGISDLAFLFGDLRSFDVDHIRPSHFTDLALVDWMIQNQRQTY